MDERKGLDYASFEKAVYPYCSDVARIKELFEIKSDSPLMNRDFFDKYVLLAAGLTETTKKDKRGPLPLLSTF